jgi:hypothetical protein
MNTPQTLLAACRRDAEGRVGCCSRIYSASAWRQLLPYRASNYISVYSPQNGLSCDREVHMWHTDEEAIFKSRCYVWLMVNSHCKRPAAYTSENPGCRQRHTSTSPLTNFRRYICNEPHRSTHYFCVVTLPRRGSIIRVGVPPRARSSLPSKARKCLLCK